MKTVDLRPLFPPVRDQGIRGTCVAFAVTAAHELARQSSIGNYEDLSDEALYWNCKQIDGDLQEGTSFDSAAEALEQAGWGENGYGYLPYAYLFQYGGQAWVMQP